MKALRRRYGRATVRDKVYEFGRTRVAVRYDKLHDEYRGELSWPEVSDNGVESPRIRHHLITRLPASHITFGPEAPLYAAAAKMVHTSGIPEFLWAAA